MHSSKEGTTRGVDFRGSGTTKDKISEIQKNCIWSDLESLYHFECKQGEVFICIYVLIQCTCKC